jgi:hypothetical protein
MHYYHVGPVRLPVRLLSSAAAWLKPGVGQTEAHVDVDPKIGRRESGDTITNNQLLYLYDFPENNSTNTKNNIIKKGEEGGLRKVF